MRFSQYLREDALNLALPPDVRSAIVNMGGKIYADILAGMTHYGNYAFRGNVGTQFLPQNNK